ncbi:MAG: Gfo/Idh/MocA family oxidoreductase [candidate division KSB1 bacterium]|jgi:predicted dehydrogenase|nr:Gfo/Idh/MocA family oxidoreductase [candidate division KSB1 bacterium]
MIKLAFIGAGDHAERCHAPALSTFMKANPGVVSAAAVCDINHERLSVFQNSFGFLNGYHNLEEMLASDIFDACLCLVPAKALVESIKRLLQLNIPILIEKPLGTHIGESRELFNMVNSHNTIHMVSANRRFVPLLNQAIAWCREKGKVAFAKCLFARPNRIEPEFIWSTGVHAVDAMRHIAGDVVDFHVDKINGVELKNRWGHITFQFSNGCSGSLELLPTSGQNVEIYEFYGQGFCASVEMRNYFQNVRLQCWCEGELALETFADDSNSLFCVRDGSYAELSEFIDAIRNQRPPKPVIRDFIQSSEICHEIDRVLVQDL